MNPTFGGYDLALLAAVSLQATLIAYVRAPRWKAFVLTLPIPFTLASLALGHPVDATNVVGLIVLLLFTHGVRWLHYGARLPIVPSIALATLGYCVIGGALARVLPRTDAAFWVAVAATLLLGGLLHRHLPHREEPGHRSPLPVWIKLPAIAVVIFGLVILKNVLHGFMTVFPMVGVVAAYEARHSLWTIGRQIPVLLITLTPLMAVCRLTQERIGAGPALALGWAVFLALLLPLTRAQWAAAKQGGA